MRYSFIFFGLMILVSSCDSRILIHDYNYKTIIEERQDKYDYNHFDYSIDNFCVIKYGFMKNPKIVKAYDSVGKLEFRSGTPFSFLVDIDKINHNIMIVYFDTIELVTKTGSYDLLNLNDINCETSITYSGKIINPGYAHNPNANAWFWERDDFQTLHELRMERNISIKNLRSKGIKNIEDRIKKSSHEYSEKELRLLQEEKNCRFEIIIRYLPINIVKDEEVKINVHLAFKMLDNSIKYAQINNIYFKEYSERYSSIHPFFIYLIPKEEDVKL